MEYALKKVEDVDKSMCKSILIDLIAVSLYNDIEDRTDMDKMEETEAPKKKQGIGTPRGKEVI